MTREEERKKNRIAALTTLAVNAVVLLVMIFTAAWSVSGPPADEYGIEVNLGYDMQGSGDIQPILPTGISEPSPGTENIPSETPEQPQPQEDTPVQPIESSEAPVETTPTEEVSATDPESPVELKTEEKKETKPAEPEKKATEKKVEEKPKVDPNAMYKGNPATGQPTSHGDDKDKSGDKGNPKGTPDANALYQKPGGGDGGDGPGLELDGWNWDKIPRPNVPDNETGRIVFLIEVDENGELIGYRKESSSVSAAAERACIAAIQNLTFTKKPGAKVPPVSKGRIVFVIRAR